MQFVNEYLLNFTDLDECALDLDACSDNATCSNTPGSYNCICDTGFEGDGYNCTGKACNLLNLSCDHVHLLTQCDQLLQFHKSIMYD